MVGWHRLREAKGNAHTRYTKMGQDTSKIASVIMHKDEDGLRQVLSSKGVKVNSLKNGDGQTPLHLAVEVDSPGCLEICLECGADVSPLCLHISRPQRCLGCLT